MIMPLIIYYMYLCSITLRPEAYPVFSNYGLVWGGAGGGLKVKTKSFQGMIDWLISFIQRNGLKVHSYYFPLTPMRQPS